MPRFSTKTSGRKPSPSGENAKLSKKMLSPMVESTKSTQKALSPSGETSKSTQKILSPMVESTKSTQTALSPSGETPTKTKTALSPTGKPSIRAGRLFPLLGDNIHTIQIFNPSNRASKVTERELCNAKQNFTTTVNNRRKQKWL